MTEQALVVGGGVAGVTVAILLARAGHRVVLVDQHRESRHKVCGEFLSTEACVSLAALGLDARALGAVPVHAVRLAGAAGVAEAQLPFTALSLTRFTLDEALLQLAAQAGVTLLRGVRAESILQVNPPSSAEPTCWKVELSTGETLSTTALFVATGKHDVRGYPRPAARHGRLIAFKQYFRLSTAQQSALESAVELILFRDGYAGLQMVEGGVANLCLLVEERRLRSLGSGVLRAFPELCAAAPHLRDRLSNAVPLLAQPLALSHIPYGYLAAPADTFWRVGDQVAVIPSFTGDGISISLHSARIAVACFLAGETPRDAVLQLRRDVGDIMTRAGRLSSLTLHRVIQPIASLLVKAWPGSLPFLADATRIPSAARDRLALRELETQHVLPARRIQ